MAVHFHEEDLPEEVKFADGPIAVDTEAMGLVPGRDRLCLVQLSDGKGDEHLVRFPVGSDYSAPALKEKLDERLERENRTALAQGCFDFIPYRALLDIAGWAEQDIFAHDG